MLGQLAQRRQRFLNAAGLRDEAGQLLGLFAREFRARFQKQLTNLVHGEIFQLDLKVVVHHSFHSSDSRAGRVLAAAPARSSQFVIGPLCELYAIQR